MQFVIASVDDGATISLEYSALTKLSIVIPTYNAEAHIERCLNSLLFESIHDNPLEIIVVNDGSTDRTLELLEKYENKHSHISVISQANQGVGAARNSGIKKSSGEYIVFLDADDRFLDGGVNYLINELYNCNSDILGFGSVNTKADSISMDLDNSFDENTLLYKSGLDYLSQNNLFYECWWYAIKLESVEKNQLKFVASNFGEDLLFTIRAFISAGEVKIISARVHNYITRSGSLRTSDNFEHLKIGVDSMCNSVLEIGGLLESTECVKSYAGALVQLRKLQESIAFYSLIRLARSELPISCAVELIKTYKRAGVFPAKEFLGGKTNSFITKFLFLFISAHSSIALTTLVAVRCGDRIYRRIK